MRQVGITGMNVLNFYFTTLNAALTNGCGKITPTVKGDVNLSEAPSGNALCIEPVRSITSAVALTGKDIYFVPAYDFAGIKVNGAAVTTTDVVADGQSLYKLAGGATVTKVSL